MDNRVKQLVNHYERGKGKHQGNEKMKRVTALETQRNRHANEVPTIPHKERNAETDGDSE